MKKINIISDSLQGNTHRENQDGVLIIDEGDYLLCFIFDGVSRSVNPSKAVETVKNYIQSEYRLFINAETHDLRNLMYSAEKILWESEWRGALTTYAALGFLREDTCNIFFSNLGDSRIYLLYEDRLQKITRDHTLYPGSNILTKCLGTGRLSEDDFLQEKLNTDSIGILLATDGFYAILENEQDTFFHVLREENCSNLKRMIRDLLQGKNYDDASYIFLKTV